jgi:uncharacterized membrane protein YeaQ/YmgE (transglycosylase-associated protein family)
MVNLMVWIALGGAIGWTVSMVMKTDSQQGILLNVVVGVVGAVVAGWMISPLVGSGTIDQNNFTLSSLIASLVGAVILLAVVNLFRRGAVR